MKYTILLTLAGIVFLIFLTSQAAFCQDFSRETIYFIMVDRFHDGDPTNNPPKKIFSPDKSEWRLYWGGDIRGIIEKLPYIKRLGCTAIWITPIVDNTEELYVYGRKKDMKISAYHGYWGRDFYRINRFFGTMDEFRELVDKAHEMDVKIVFDYVLNHSSPIKQGIDGAVYKKGRFIVRYGKDDLNWFHHKGRLNFKNKKDPKEWQDKNLFDLADFNSENPEVDEYLIEAARMWLKTGIDAFRLDTARHVPAKTVAKFAKAMKKVAPDVFIFGEWSEAGATVPEALEYIKRSDTSIIDFQFCYAIRQVLAEGKSFKRMAKLIEHDPKLADPNHVVTCIDNHDMPRFIVLALKNGLDDEKARNRTEMAVYLMMASRGIPCIYYGTEQFLYVKKKSNWGMGGDPYNRQMMTGWDNFNRLGQNIKRFAKLRQELPVVSKGDQKTVFVKNNLWVFERRHGGGVMLVAANKGRARKVKVETNLSDGKYYAGGPRRFTFIGPNIEVKQGRTEFTISEDSVYVWYHK